MAVNLDKCSSEFIGILIGDGHLHYSDMPGKRKNYYVSISGSLSEDLAYHKNHVRLLFYKLFKEDIRILRQRHDEILTKKHSKKIVALLNERFQIPIGNKTSTCRVPEIIKNTNKTFKSRFLRGLADTDFSLMFKDKGSGKHTYPTIRIGFKSLKLVEDIYDMLKGFDFRFGKIIKEKYYDIRSNKKTIKYSIYIYGKKNLEKWMKEIGFKNDKHITKYLIWKRFGHCPIRTTLKKRQQILSQKFIVS